MRSAVKKLTLWLPLLVLAGLVVGFLRRPRQPEFTDIRGGLRRPAPQFEQLHPPVGALELSGQLLATDGAPAAEVPLYSRCGGVPRWTTTTADGRFVFAGLVADEVELVSAAWGCEPAKWQLSAASSPHVLHLPAAASDIPVQGPIRRADLAGRVVRSLEEPVDGYEVVLTPADPPETIQPATPRRVLIAADGTFRFEGLVLARYVVQVLPAWARGGSWPDLLAPELAALDHAAVSEDLTLTLHEGEIEGRVVDEDAQPVPGALVTLISGDQDLHTFPWDSTQGDGTFHLRDLPAGTYRVEIHAGEGLRVEPAVEVLPRTRRRLGDLPLVLRKPVTEPRGAR